MHITDGQDYAITLSMGKYDRDKSNIIFEGGNETKDGNGNACYIGSFIVHIYRKGKYRFDCEFIGEREYSVEKRKI